MRGLKKLMMIDFSANFPIRQDFHSSMFPQKLLYIYLIFIHSLEWVSLDPKVLKQHGKQLIL